MAALSLTGLILGLVLRSQAVQVTNEENPDNPLDRASWGYGPTNGPATWPATYATCAGSMQSPIDLKDAKTVDPGAIEMVGYSLPLNGVVENNGHTLKFTFSGGIAPYIMGGRLPPGERFDFLQLHWHWGSVSTQGSEHTMDGREYPMEIHLVHWNKKYADVATAVQHSDGLAVLGFFYEVSHKDNPNLNSILSLVHTVRMKQLRMEKREKKQEGKRKKGKKQQERVTESEGMVAVPGQIQLSQLIADNIGDYYYYQGGLTTPTCDEVVLWTNYMSTIPISEAQLSKFRSLVDSTGHSLNDNYRPPQPLNARTIYMTKSSGKPGVALGKPGGGIDILGAGIMAAVITGIASLFLPQQPTGPNARQRLSEAEQRLRQGQTSWDY